MIAIILVILIVSVVLWKFFLASGEEDISSNSGFNESWYGTEEKLDDAEDNSIHSFSINVPEEVLTDLKSRLSLLRFEEPLVDSRFHYGFNTNYLRKVAEYWKEKYDWRKQEQLLNKFPHFKTKIEGINVHYIHAKPNLSVGDNVKVLPLLMVHGWPGSVVEFYKVIPLLTTPHNGYAFEVICPSIPGFGFSESPHRKGFNQRSTARFFVTLMMRLNHQTFFVQGGDWGALVTQLIAKYYPFRVRGLHLNIYNSLSKSPVSYIKMFFIAYFPFLVSKAQYHSLFPLKEKFLLMLREMGYMHLQGTKPDTIGVALSNHPIALAAYILEKFSSWTDFGNLELEDGGLTKKYTLDELLTNVMLYWVNNNITASVRYYKEFIIDPDRQKHDDLPIKVPTGIALFPNELLGIPKCLTIGKVMDLVSYTEMPRGGHFAALEEPNLLAEDIWKFVELVVNRAC